jgi:hypothetical protein
MRPALLRLGAVLAGLGLLAAAWLWLPDALGMSRAKPPVSVCTLDAPCRFRVMFAYTAAGLAQLEAPARDRAALRPCFQRYGDWGYCLARRMARENVEALSRAFEASGITQVSGSRRSIAFLPGEVTATASPGLDAGEDMRLDNGSSYGLGAAFNGQMLDWLEGQGQITRWGREHQFIVVFTGLQGPLGGCAANSVSRDGLVLIPGCVAWNYLEGTGADRTEELLFLHEIGHGFGAWHNDYGNPQPCRMAQQSGFAADACAWETCTDGAACARSRLIDEPKAFCTLVGQYNLGSGDTFCRAHHGGLQGSGWIEEYSHPGPCRTPGWERFACGDAGHDAVRQMRWRAPQLATQRAGGAIVFLGFEHARAR